MQSAVVARVPMMEAGSRGVNVFGVQPVRRMKGSRNVLVHLLRESVHRLQGEGRYFRWFSRAKAKKQIET